MTLQQLRYLIAIANNGSISAAAHELFVSQSSLSVAVRDIERECGITVFDRSNRGITLTNEGLELLGYARQVVEQADLMEARYATDATPISQKLAISSQHYAFVTEAFLEFVEEYEGEGYTFSLSETRTAEIIEDVREFRSDVGVLYTSSFNEAVLARAFEDAKLTFTPLFRARPHVFLGEHHPLAASKTLRIEDLAEYPRYTFEQGTTNSFFYAEEPLAELPHEKRVMIATGGTLSNLLTHHVGFTVSTGVLSSEMLSGVVAIPLDTEESMTVGYIVHVERRLSDLALAYIEKLKLIVAQAGLEDGR